MKICKYCGITEEETRIINGNICRKHYLQLRKHGKVGRSIYDKNRYSVLDGVVTMELYDIKGNVTTTTKFNVKRLEEVINIKWYLKQGYVRGTFNGGKLFLHRYLTNCPDDKVIDHIDRDPLNNLDSNLRICNQSNNSKNRLYTKSTEHVGVRKVPSGRWSSIITVMYKTIYLGTFDTFEQAVEVRLQAEVIYFKDFSVNT